MILFCESEFEGRVTRAIRHYAEAYKNRMYHYDKTKSYMQFKSWF